MFNPFRHKPPAIILGMHRSGTSYLTGSLEEAGVYLGYVFQWNPYNKKGHRESKIIIDLHDAILAANGGSWLTPPDLDVIPWQDQHKATRDKVVANYQKFGGRRFKSAYWGFKDPRALLVLEGWLEVLPDARFIGIFRHPEKVVSSLQNRKSDISDEVGLAAWQRYIERLLRFHNEFGFPLICFDDPENELKKKIRLITQGLRTDRKRINFFRLATAFQPIWSTHAQAG